MSCVLLEYPVFCRNTEFMAGCLFLRYTILTFSKTYFLLLVAGAALVMSEELYGLTDKTQPR